MCLRYPVIVMSENITLSNRYLFIDYVIVAQKYPELYNVILIVKCLNHNDNVISDNNSNHCIFIN